ncbi:hypothetical protein [Herpetosiphon gulosus]|uniref:Uncharacterized protein n=1 Tax=Herpetosiphon gulosus TaxID=1973496 RepID=A0ABP9WW07_9CHLR
MNDRARWPQPLRRWVVGLLLLSSLSWLAAPLTPTSQAATPTPPRY